MGLLWCGRVQSFVALAHLADIHDNKSPRQVLGADNALMLRISRSANGVHVCDSYGQNKFYTPRMIQRTSLCFYGVAPKFKAQIRTEEQGKHYAAT